MLPGANMHGNAVVKRGGVDTIPQPFPKGKTRFGAYISICKKVQRVLELIWHFTWMYVGGKEFMWAFES